jgi:hypothetical protein
VGVNDVPLRKSRQKPCKANPTGQRENQKQHQRAENTILTMNSSKTESMEGSNKWDFIFVSQSLALD